MGGFSGLFDAGSLTPGAGQAAVNASKEDGAPKKKGIDFAALLGQLAQSGAFDQSGGTNAPPGEFVPNPFARQTAPPSGQIIFTGGELGKTPGAVQVGNAMNQSLQGFSEAVSGMMSSVTSMGGGMMGGGGGGGGAGAGAAMGMLGGGGGAAGGAGALSGILSAL